MHNSFAITWEILGVMILMLIPITNYSNIPKELYITKEQSKQLTKMEKSEKPKSLAGITESIDPWEGIIMSILKESKTK